MVTGDVVMNFSEVVTSLPPGITENFGGLITFLKAASVAFIIYVAYLIFVGVLRWREYGKVKKIEKTVESIEKKLNSLGRKKKKR